MTTIDHVIFVVDDLDAAARRLLDEHGLASVPGGRHPGHGTGNRIVPLGSDYLELMAVLDPVEAASSPMGRWARSHASPTLLPAAVCLRVDDIEAAATALGEVPLSMSRRTPDGGELSWRLAGFDGMVHHGFPFFIQWDGDAHPGTGSAAHRCAPRRIASVTIGPIPDAIRGIIGMADGIVIDGDAPVSSVSIETENGAIDLG